jgi:hypothetical protein
VPAFHTITLAALTRTCGQQKAAPCADIITNALKKVKPQTSLAMLLFWITFINLQLLAMACLNTWRPYSFEYFNGMRKWYSVIVAAVHSAVVGFRYTRRTGKIMKAEEYEQVLYGPDPAKWAPLEYRYNITSFFVWQIIATIILLCIGTF